MALSLNELTDFVARKLQIMAKNVNIYD